jgi:hypothetical protein
MDAVVFSSSLCPAFWVATGASPLSLVFPGGGPASTAAGDASPTFWAATLTAIFFLIPVGGATTFIYFIPLGTPCSSSGWPKGLPSSIYLWHIIRCHQGHLTASLPMPLFIFHLEQRQVQSLPTVPYIISLIVFFVSLVKVHHQVHVDLLVFFFISQGVPQQ